MTRALLWFALASIAAGCSSNDASPAASSDGGADDATSGADAASDARPPHDAGSDAPPPPNVDPCQPLEPIPGAPCPQAGTACEYGSDPHAACWTYATCELTPDAGADLTWDDDEPAPGCSPANDPSCPATFGATAACPANAARCDYPEGRCACIDCNESDGGASTEWGCRKWTDVGPGGTAGPSGCPVNRPHLGDPCSVDQTVCFYDGACTDISLGPAMKCKLGYWYPTPDPGLACAPRTCTP